MMNAPMTSSPNVFLFGGNSFLIQEAQPQHDIRRITGGRRSEWRLKKRGRGEAGRRRRSRNSKCEEKKKGTKIWTGGLRARPYRNRGRVETFMCEFWRACMPRAVYLPLLLQRSTQTRRDAHVCTYFTGIFGRTRNLPSSPKPG